MNILLEEGTRIESTYGRIEVTRTEVYRVSMEQPSKVTIRLQANTAYWWLSRNEFKQAIAEGKIRIIKENR